MNDPTHSTRDETAHEQNAGASQQASRREVARKAATVGVVAGTAGITALARPTAAEEDDDIDVNPNVDIHVRRCLDYDHVVDYSVTYTDPETGTRYDVTDNTEVESGNTDAVMVNPIEHTITTTDNEDIVDRVRLAADYSGADGYGVEYATVAPVELQHTGILPPWCRIQAAFGNGNLLTVLVATLAGVFGTRLASSFAGLGFATLAVVIAWFGGWATSGIAMVAVFLTLFIGLNMAANIDYTMQR